jgi:hypothetical protein
VDRERDRGPTEPHLPPFSRSKEHEAGLVKLAGVGFVLGAIMRQREGFGK